MSHLRRLIATTALASITAIAPQAQAQETEAQETEVVRAETDDARLDAIIAQMTLDEKIENLGGGAIGVPRLGIEGVSSSEAISGMVLSGGASAMFVKTAEDDPEGLAAWAASRGVSDEDLAARVAAGREVIPSTQFPQGIGIARTWNRALVRQVGNVIGSEARWIHENEDGPGPLIVWTPNSDPARDPRWGRTQEAYGEDPFLAGALSVALIDGIQGDGEHWQAASLLKHFLANSNERNRYGSSANFDATLFWDYYAKPFRMSFVEGGARAFMSSYNAFNGTPMAVNAPIVRDIVLEQWGANGMVTTDGFAPGRLVTAHNAFPNMAEAVAASIRAGHSKMLPAAPDAVREAIEQGLLTGEQIDSAVRQNLRMLAHLGTLEEVSPFASVQGTPDPVNSEAHNAVARQVSREAMVLLKNEGSFLPLDPAQITSVAVIGSMADTVEMDHYSGIPPYKVTPLQAIRDRLGPDVTVTYVADNTDGAAVAAASAADVVLMIVGNDPKCGLYRGLLFEGFSSADATCPVPGEGMENHDRVSMDLPEEELVKAVHAANPNTAVVLVASFPYTISWSQENVPAILTTSHAGQEEGTAIAETLFGDYNPGGKLIMTWPRSMDQLPPMMDYDIRNGHTYMYFGEEPLYPFGHGLSYTSFTYADLTVSPDAIAGAGAATVSVSVTNSGPREGDEVVQLYMRREAVDDVAVPTKELVGFARVHRASGETKRVELPLGGEALMRWSRAEHALTVPEGGLTLMVGGSSADVKLETALATD